MVQKTEPVFTDFTWETRREGSQSHLCQSGLRHLTRVQDKDLMQVVLKRRWRVPADGFLLFWVLTSVRPASGNQKKNVVHSCERSWSFSVLWSLLMSERRRRWPGWEKSEGQYVLVTQISVTKTTAARLAQVCTWCTAQLEGHRL